MNLTPSQQKVVRELALASDTFNQDVADIHMLAYADNGEPLGSLSLRTDNYAPFIYMAMSMFAAHADYHGHATQLMTVENVLLKIRSNDDVRIVDASEPLLPGDHILQGVMVTTFNPRRDQVSVQLSSYKRTGEDTVIWSDWADVEDGMTPEQVRNWQSMHEHSREPIQEVLQTGREGISLGGLFLMDWSHTRDGFLRDDFPMNTDVSMFTMVPWEGPLGGQEFQNMAQAGPSPLNVRQTDHGGSVVNWQALPVGHGMDEVVVNQHCTGEALRAMDNTIDVLANHIFGGH